MYTHRFANRDVSAQDAAVDRANVLDLQWTLQAAAKLRITLAAHNLLDDAYRLATDRKAPTAFGRHFLVRGEWRLD